MMRHVFPKTMKLCGDIRIRRTQQGKRIVAWPLRAHVTPSDTGKTQVLVWAPKSLFKHAVQRNHLRRLMREAYRLNQDIIAAKHYLIAFNYIDKEEQSFAVIEKAVVKALLKVKSEK